MASQKQVRAAANARAAIGNQAALIKGSAAAKERMAALRAMRGGPRKNLASVRAAKAAFTRFYNKRSYKRPSARKAAMTRDLCSANKPVIQDRRYLRSPHRYDYPGWDDGSNCPEGHKVQKGKRAATAAQAAARVAKGSAAAKARMAKVRAAKRS